MSEIDSIKTTISSLKYAEVEHLRKCLSTSMEKTEVYVTAYAWLSEHFAFNFTHLPLYGRNPLADSIVLHATSKFTPFVDGAITHSLLAACCVTSIMKQSFAKMN